MIDSFGKLEYIDEYFDSIKDRLGFSESLPHVNKTKHKSYQEYYDDELIELLETHYADELKMFDYTFED